MLAYASTHVANKTAFTNKQHAHRHALPDMQFSAWHPGENIEEEDDEAWVVDQALFFTGRANAREEQQQQMAFGNEGGTTEAVATAATAAAS